MLPPPLAGLYRPHDLKQSPSLSSSTCLPCFIFLPRTFCYLTVSSFGDMCPYQSGRAIKAGLCFGNCCRPTLEWCLTQRPGTWDIIYSARMLNSNFCCNNLSGKASSWPLLMSCPPRTHPFSQVPRPRCKLLPHLISFLYQPADYHPKLLLDSQMSASAPRLPEEGSIPLQ